MISVRNRIKRSAERALLAGGVAALGRKRRSQQLLIFAYHNIVPAGSQPVGDDSLHLAQGAFALQLDALMKTHDVIALNDAIAERHSRSSTALLRPRAVITFDDAYSGALTAGVAELRARGLPATIFVTPSFLDGEAFWWDLFADGSTGLDANLRDRALAGGGRITDAVGCAGAMALSQHTVPPYARGASMHDLERALDYNGIRLAGHTWSHPNLSVLPAAELIDELSRPLAWLKQFGDRTLPMISYPYGLANERVRAAARDVGYTAGFMINGGWTTCPPELDLFAIPRLNVPADVSLNGFVLRAAGVIHA